jgi:hypothetical protein
VIVGVTGRRMTCSSSARNYYSIQLTANGRPYKLPSQFNNTVGQTFY